MRSRFFFLLDFFIHESVTATGVMNRPNAILVNEATSFLTYRVYLKKSHPDAPSETVCYCSNRYQFVTS